jgi:hypothetical protein
MNIIRHLPQFALATAASFCLLACSAAQEQAFLSNAPSVITGALASANDLYAAYSAANQQLTGKTLNVSTGLTAANAAEGSLASNSTGLSTSVNQVFSGLNALATSLKAANPSVTSAQIVSAQSAQITAGQVAVQAATPPASTSTTMFQIHYNPFDHKLMVVAVK